MELIKCFFILLLFSIQIIGLSQDYIYLKNNTIQEGKVIEVTVDKIRYMKSEIKNSPIYEIFKTDAVKILYPTGYTDIFDTSYAKNNVSSIDTTTFSIIYVLFHNGQDRSEKVPLYFNGHYICTMMNYMRMKFKIYSEGILSCERRLGERVGPSVNLLIQHGKTYAISINIDSPYALDPNKKFSLITYTGHDEVEEFLKKRYYHFKSLNPDLDLKEDINYPICIQK